MIGGINKDKRYPNNTDPRPKRRKDKYNPYTIYSVGAETNEPHFYVTFADTTGKKVCTEISKEIFDLLNQFELEDLSYLNEIDRHYAYLDQTELESHMNSLSLSPLPQDMFEYDDLYAAINKLPKKQQIRIKLYYFDGLSIEEIAKIEQTTFQAVSKSIIVALRNLKKSNILRTFNKSL